MRFLIIFKPNCFKCRAPFDLGPKNMSGVSCLKDWYFSKFYEAYQTHWRLFSLSTLEQHIHDLCSFFICGREIKAISPVHMRVTLPFLIRMLFICSTDYFSKPRHKDRSGAGERINGPWKTFFSRGKMSLSFLFIASLAVFVGRNDGE